jgi:membrane associated rhomboid family serine protease
VFPIGDQKIPNSPPPFITWLLILINVIVFIYELGMPPEARQAFVYNYSAIPNKVLSGDHVYGIFTSMFLHGGWMHIIGNMFFLWVFGDNVETVLGHIRYLFFYLAGGIVASLAHIIATMNDIPSLGASGAISAVLGAYIVMFPRSQIRTLVFLGFFITTMRISAFIFLGIWFFIQLISSSGGADSGVAWYAHIGGFIFGILIGFVFKRRAKLRLNYAE